jgi:hypothetical protein
MPEFENLMRQLKSGSYISSATKEASIISATTTAVPQSVGGWVSEAGICTLHDLFSQPIRLEERNTLAFRELLREVLDLYSSCLLALKPILSFRFCRAWPSVFRSFMSVDSPTTNCPPSFSRCFFVVFCMFSSVFMSFSTYL